MTIHTLVATLCITACSGPALPTLVEVVPLPVQATEDTVGPYLATGADGTVVLTWMRRGDQGGTLRYSTLGDDGWGAPVDVVSDPNMFVNWADLPSVRNLSDRYWVAHWLSKSAAATYAYDVLLAFSADGGVSWSKPVRPHADGTPTEHGFVSIRPFDDSAALLWLDGRKTISESSDDASATSMTLRAATVSPDGSLANEQLVDDMVCDCCQTDVTVSSEGPIAVYRDRTVDEIRDIYVTRYTNGAWQPGEPIADDGWNIAGCPVNGPAIDAAGEFVAVAWFSAADNAPIVRAVLSTDGGRTFGEPVTISNGSTSGHVGIVVIDDASAAVSWVESAGAQGFNNINVRVVNTRGPAGPVRTVGQSELLRIHPQLARSDDGLVLAWTEALGDSTRIASARVPVRNRGR